MWGSGTRVGVRTLSQRTLVNGLAYTSMVVRLRQQFCKQEPRRGHGNAEMGSRAAATLYKLDGETIAPKSEWGIELEERGIVFETLWLPLAGFKLGSPRKRPLGAAGGCSSHGAKDTGVRPLLCNQFFLSGSR